ncbi:MAG: hypothetical protein HGA87_03200 [Desulfobulbaceae bacterium]|nr:hypothetical protein [Desulfobulbaceae bacterium]
MIELLLGIPIGIATSLVAWYILFHVIAPTVEFFPSVFKSRTRKSRCGWNYRVKFRNTGTRDIVDLELVAKVRIRGLSQQRPSFWNAIYLPVDDSRIPKVRSHRGTSKRFVILVHPSEISDSAKSALPTELQSKCENGTLSLEDLLNLGSQATFQVFAFAYDSFSGSRRLFESPTFSIKDIIEEAGGDDELNEEHQDAQQC